MSTKIKMRATQRKSAKGRTDGRKASSIALCDAAMTRPTTIVRVKSNPFQNVRALNTELPAMRDALKSMLGSYMKAYKNEPGKLAAHSVTMHEDHCVFGVILWPRVSEGADLEEMQDAVAERNEHCSCKPIIMYPRAMA